MSDEELAIEQDETMDETAAEEASEPSDQEKAMARLREAISVEKEEIGPLRLKLTVTIPPDTLNERRQEQFSELKRDALVPGFRKGHAPLRLIEKRFASDVGEQLKTQLFSSGYLAAVEKEELKVLGDPLFWVKVTEQRVGENQEPKKVETEKLLPVDKALDYLEMPKEGGLTFACEVELKPDFELPELTKIPIIRPKFSIDDEDVDRELRRIRLLRGTYQPVEDGKIEPDDMLYADLKMTVDGEVVAVEDNFDLAARDVRVKGVPMIGFGGAAVGKRVGDLIEFEAPVPDDHENIDLRSKTAHFDITVREVKRLVLPPIDEEFVKSIGFESEADLRQFMRASLESRVGATLKDAMREQIGEYLVRNAKLEIPEGLSNRQTERMVARRKIELYQAGLPQTEVEKQMDQLRASARDQVVRDLKLYFVLERIAEEREIEVVEEELNGAIAAIAQRANKRFDRVRDELSKGDAMTLLYHRIRDEKVLDALIADAVITETESPKKKSEPAPAEKAPAKPKKAPPEASAAPAKAKPASKPAVRKEPAAKRKTDSPKTSGRKTAHKVAKKKSGRRGA